MENSFRGTVIRKQKGSAICLYFKTHFPDFYCEICSHCTGTTCIVPRHEDLYRTSPRVRTSSWGSVLCHVYVPRHEDQYFAVARGGRWTGTIGIQGWSRRRYKIVIHYQNQCSALVWLPWIRSVLGMRSRIRIVPVFFYNWDWQQQFFDDLTWGARKLTTIVRHVTGTGSGLLGGIPRVVVQISAVTLKGPL
jgi:hypothetical protein